MSISPPTVLLCGIPSEPPLAMAAEALRAQGTPFMLFNQREYRSASIEFEIGPGGLGGVLIVGDTRVALEEIQGVYSRLTDFQILPEIIDIASHDPEYLYCQNFHRAMERWIEITPARVVNRTRSMGSNGSKPYQSQIIRKYFYIPETLITNDGDEALAFGKQYGRVIYKSMSGMRSIVTELGDRDEERLDDLSICPVLFQKKVEGVDIRVHTVGNESFATKVESKATDYRYGNHLGQGARLSPVELPEDVQAACLQLAADLELAFSGIDLRMTPEGEFYCFEVNPSPAYSYYESSTGQPISKALARYLSCDDEAY